MIIKNRRLKVFLCHSKDDKPKVRELYRRLVADGFDAWLDEEKLMPGQDWDLEIRRAVRESGVVVVCLSNSSITKAGYVQKEIRFALDVADEQPEGEIFIIPIRIDDCQVPTRISKWHWVNLFEEKGYRKLRSSLELRAKRLGIAWRLSFDLEPQIVKIPAGKFLMGSTKEQAAQVIKDGVDKDWVRYEQPQHIVELSEYFIGKYPITNREYQGFVHDTKFAAPRDWYRNQFPAEKSDFPAVNISWDYAVAYCKWLSVKSGKHYRLPTEAEWEKAARGEDGRLYSWGDDFDPKKANTREANLRSTSKIGIFSPQGDSIYGCVDMIGNVWEWCNDWFDEKEYINHNDGIQDPHGPQHGISRVLRGGSFDSNLSLARCAFRLKVYPSPLSFDIGFRVVSPSSS